MDPGLDQDAKLILVMSRNLATFLDSSLGLGGGHMLWKSLHHLYCDTNYKYISFS